MLSRRQFLYSASALTAGLAIPHSRAATPTDFIPTPLLDELTYGDVTITSELHENQLHDTVAVLMNLSEDGLMQPFRQMAGQPAPGDDLGGWYRYDPNYDYRSFDAGFAPTATFGQWVSALARTYAITGDPRIREKVLRLNALYAKTIDPGLYTRNRFPAYCYDKLTGGLIDAHKWVNDPDAFRILGLTADTALPNLPGHAIEHGTNWRFGKDVSWSWDESYTMPENQFLAFQRGAGKRYRDIGIAYLNDDYFAPLAEGRSVLEGKHAYSHVNALCSAMQAYLTLGSQKHFLAAKNGFEMVAAQSFATGGWGPDETLRAPGSEKVAESLTSTHHSFETPCGAYAHFKITRYLLRMTQEARYGDSMERVMYNTVLGSKSLGPDGRAFYYSDYNFAGRKVYSSHRWPCCSGTLPQVAADYRLNLYLRSPRGVFVNLYVPSTLRWAQDAAQLSLTQRTEYPFDPHIAMELSASRPSDVSLFFRIPAWAAGATLRVNSKPVESATVTPGTFLEVRRTWKSGDRIDLELPLAKRLEPISSAKPNIVALLSGPLVLFAITGSTPTVTRQQLLAATMSPDRKWQAQTYDKTLTLLPFTAISDEQYSTYLNVT